MTAQYGYALIGLTALVVMLVALAGFAAVRLFAAARGGSGRRREPGSETALLSDALQEAVTRLRAQEQAMSARAKASERLNSEIVASLAAGLLVAGETGQVRILNPAGRRLLGIADDVAAADVRARLEADSPLLAVVDECVRTQAPAFRRALRISVGDHVIHVGVTVSPLVDADGEHGAICLFSDVTAVLEMEEQLRLKDALARLGEMTAGIAHEFRNGLATIHGYGQLIPPEALPEPYGPYVIAIRDEADALGRVITNFLSFARPDRVAFAPVDLGPLVARAAEEAGLGQPGSRIRAEGEFGIVEGDEVLLRQMVMNLVRNALEACAGVGRPGEVLVEGRVEPAAGVCHLIVHDRGPGVVPALRDRVFQPFFTTRAAGTGLGLAIVQKVAVTHNGLAVVDVPSRFEGASMRVTLPLLTNSVTKRN